MFTLTSRDRALGILNHSIIVTHAELDALAAGESPMVELKNITENPSVALLIRTHNASGQAVAPEDIARIVQTVTEKLAATYERRDDADIDAVVHVIGIGQKRLEKLYKGIGMLVGEIPMAGEHDALSLVSVKDEAEFLTGLGSEGLTIDENGFLQAAEGSNWKSTDLHKGGNPECL